MNIDRFAALLIPLSLLAGLAGAQDDYAITDDVVYGHKDGLALTFDVIKPKEPNGAAVLFLQSGGWYSTWRNSKELVPASMPLLNKGFTVFIVRHGSAPKYTGQNVINPIAAISAMAMLLEHTGQPAAAARVARAIQRVTGTKMKSQAAGKMGHSTSEVGDLVVQALDD